MSNVHFFILGSWIFLASGASPATRKAMAFGCMVVAALIYLFER